MQLVRLFKNVPLGEIPVVAANVAGTPFAHKSLEDIRRNEDDFYDFISHVIKVTQSR